jgi:probable F420-dependent oxidoreductase
MKLAVDFPSVAYKEGPEKITALARAIEDIGYDELSVFDHVVMGYPTETRARPIYPPQMPIIEALMLLAHASAVTTRIGLGTEVLVLPQRDATLVAKQIASLDTLSGGRVRLGVGVGWQASEYEAMGFDFSDRGRRMDEAIDLLRAWWGDERVDLVSDHHTVVAMAMEPKPPQGRSLPIWIGGGSAAALRRVVQRGDGWMGTAMGVDEMAEAVATITRLAEEAGRDPASIGLQTMLQAPPRDAAAKGFYADHDAVAARAAQLAGIGFGWLTVNATAIFQAGARSVDAMVEQLGAIHRRLRAEVG